MRKYTYQAWVFIEIMYAKILRKFGVRKNKKHIPKGPYCYQFDEERNKKEPIDGYWIKPCKYYRSLNGQINAGCTYIGFAGNNFSLGDQCKICGVDDVD